MSGPSTGANQARAIRLLEMWTALEALSPQSYRRPDDLLTASRSQVVPIDGAELVWSSGLRAQPNRRVYHHVLLGELQLGAAYSALNKRFVREEQELAPPAHSAALAVLLCNEQGVPLLDSLTLSSFAWALPIALGGDLQKLKNLPEDEEKLVAGLRERLEHRDAEGQPLPLTLAAVTSAREWLVAELGLPPALVRPAGFFLREYAFRWIREPPETLLLDSFFLGELSRARKLVVAEKAPKALLRYLGAMAPENAGDALRDRALFSKLLEPERTPRGRWPGGQRRPLVALQQAAVNAAMSSQPGDVTGVNGPPGTGKTTLLKDIVAAVITSRAEVLAGFSHPHKAFTRTGIKFTRSQAKFELRAIDPKLHGFEIIVASSNNKAVENVSAELPTRSAVAEDAPELRYFSSLATALRGEECWGLVAAVLGNSTNLRAFFDTFWEDQDRGIETYLAAAAGTPRVVTDAGGKGRAPHVLRFEDVPSSPAEAGERWKAARKAFRDALKASKASAQRLQKISELDKRLAEARASGNQRQERSTLRDLETRSQGVPTVEALWANSHVERQLSTPWFDAEQQRVRDEVFIAAVHLHKAFIDAAAEPIRHNLASFRHHLRRPLPDAEAEEVRDLFATFALVVPVFSTTFASVERMLRRLAPASLGWLLIDEGGQATPQAAVGAIVRAERVIVVGDPMQVEPVVLLPKTLVASICTHFEVAAADSAAPFASAQSLADAASSYATSFETRDGTRTVGLPLLVHRRCAEPMFGISNAVAYENLMVKATPARVSRVGEVLRESCWYHVFGNADGHWCPEEGEVLVRMLRRLQDKGVDPDLYVISPFRAVAERSRALLSSTPDLRGFPLDRIGTIHTVQGREADAVILLLGATDGQHEGARRWAGSRPNLLNVAVTRAQERLYVVGNHDLWSSAGCFELLSARLPRKNIPLQRGR